MSLYLLRSYSMVWCRGRSAPMEKKKAQPLTGTLCGPANFVMRLLGTKQLAGPNKSRCGCPCPLCGRAVSSCQALLNNSLRNSIGSAPARRCRISAACCFCCAVLCCAVLCCKASLGLPDSSFSLAMGVNHGGVHAGALRRRLKSSARSGEGRLRGFVSWIS